MASKKDVRKGGTAVMERLTDALPATARRANRKVAKANKKVAKSMRKHSTGWRATATGIAATAVGAVLAVVALRRRKH